MSDLPKTKAEFIAAIEEAKRRHTEMEEARRNFRTLAASLIRNPLTPPETIAWIEVKMEESQRLREANQEVEQQLADLFFEHDIDALFAEKVR